MTGTGIVVVENKLYNDEKKEVHKSGVLMSQECNGKHDSARRERLRVRIPLDSQLNLRPMKKNNKDMQHLVPEKSGCCATCFFKFHDRSSETGFYCTQNHKEVLPNGSC